MNWYRIGSYIWTSCSAGWLVLYLITELPVCFFVSLGCAVCSFAWNGWAARRDLG